MKNIDKEIADAEAKLESLKLKKARLTQLTPEQKVARLLHEMFCNANHADGCSWFYEVSHDTDDWDKDTHVRYLGKAERLCDAINQIVDNDVQPDVEQFLVELSKAVNQ